MSRHDLLPPNATTLERDFSRVTSSLQRAGGPVPIIRTAKRVNIPDSVLPWLIFEYGLGEILPYLGNNQRRAIAEGVLWQRIRGTPEAVRIALGWIGVDGFIDESEAGSSRWAEYQLGLEEATSGDEIIDNIVGVSRISSPVRSRLQRIHAVYDIRQLVWDQGRLDDGMWDDHSGVRPRPEWPQISYGQILSSHLEENATVASAHTSSYATRVYALTHFRWDHSVWDQDRDVLNYPALVSNQEGFSAQYQGQVWGPFRWRAETWEALNVVISSSMQPPEQQAETGFVLGPASDFQDGVLQAESLDFGSLAFTKQGSIAFVAGGGPLNTNALEFQNSGWSWSTLRAAWDRSYDTIGDVYTMEAYVNLGPLPTSSESEHTVSRLIFGCLPFRVDWRIESLWGEVRATLEANVLGGHVTFISHDVNNYESLDLTPIIWAPSEWKRLALVRDLATEPGYLTLSLYFDDQRMWFDTIERSLFDDLNPDDYRNQDSFYWKWEVQGMHYGEAAQPPRMHGFRLVKGTALYQGETI